MDQKKKYLFVYLKTGGGHLAPARAIFNYLSTHFPDKVEPRLVYGFEKTPRWVQYIIEDGYRMLQYTGKWIFELLYAFNKITLLARITCNLLAPFMIKHLEEEIIKQKPTKIINLHFFCIIPIYKILKRNKLSIPVQTVITDPFTPHPMWFLLRNQNFIVFSKRLEERIIKKKRGHSVKSFPFILDEKFSKSSSASEIVSLKMKYNYDNTKKVLLILGGGDGIPKGELILEELLKTEPDYEIGIVCGKNEQLFKGAERLKKKYQQFNNIIVYGYVDFIYELINISDVVLTKCGASTIMEILNLKRVPVVNDYIWEQEQGNVDYLIEKKLGIYEPKIKNLPAVINELFKNEKLYDSYKEKIIEEKIENGLPAVTHYLINESHE